MLVFLLGKSLQHSLDQPLRKGNLLQLCTLILIVESSTVLEKYSTEDFT